MENFEGSMSNKEIPPKTPATPTGPESPEEVERKTALIKACNSFDALCSEAALLGEIKGVPAEKYVDYLRRLESGDFAWLAFITREYSLRETARQLFLKKFTPPKE